MISSGVMTSHQTVCVSPSCPAPLEPSPHCQSVAGLNFSYSCYFDICSSELEESVLLAHTLGSSTRYSNRLHDFSVTISGCYKDVYINSSFLTHLDSGILCMQNAFL